MYVDKKQKNKLDHFHTPVGITAEEEEEELHS